MRKTVFRNSFTVCFILCCIFFAKRIQAQEASSHISRILHFPDKVFNRIDKEANKTEQKITSSTEKYLHKLQRQEEKIKRKLWKKDSTKAKEVFGDVKGRYDALRNSINNPQAAIQNQTGSYIGHMDSVTTAVNFLQANFDSAIPSSFGGVGGGLQSITNLQNSFNQTELIRKQIQQRQQYLKDQLQNTALLKELKQFRKQVYYYQQQAREYKEALSNPNKLGKKLLETAVKFPAFQNFFRQNSELASLFQLPGNPSSFGGVGGGASFAGLQTRAAVQQQLIDRFGAQTFATPAGGGASPFQQQIQAAQTEIQKLKDKLPNASSFGTGGEEGDMPDFRTNPEKTRPFLKRIEIGTNMQTTRGNFYFPVVSDLGVSLGFKASAKSIFGIGASYKIGLGQNWENIRITHQGAGLRTFIDYKIKGGFWISGGGEMNYRPESSFRNVTSLPLLGEAGRGLWQRSALLGISKKYNVGKKWKGNAQVLYDFLWNQQVPMGQQVVFRVGYNIK